jgi:L-lactate dehydrogenase complex protein LldE
LNVALFITCLTDSFYPRAGVAAVKVLERLGCTVAFPAAQTCCGQPMFNTGFHHDARDLAERMIRVFEPHETVVTPSGSCAAMIREHYPALFEPGDPRRTGAEALARKTFEFVEFLVKVLKVDLATLGAHWQGSVTCHYSCHLRSLGMTDEAPRLLGQIEGIEVRPLPGAEQCCGFGGTFAVKFPLVSGRMVRDKVDSVLQTGAATLACSDAGCAMNIEGACRRRSEGGEAIRLVSAAEIIAESLGLLERETLP